jgi:hypothetical protein
MIPFAESREIPRLIFVERWSASKNRTRRGWRYTNHALDPTKRATLSNPHLQMPRITDSARRWKSVERVSAHSSRRAALLTCHPPDVPQSKFFGLRFQQTTGVPTRFPAKQICAL